MALWSASLLTYWRKIMSQFKLIENEESGHTELHHGDQFIAGWKAIKPVISEEIKLRLGHMFSAAYEEGKFDRSKEIKYQFKKLGIL